MLEFFGGSAYGGDTRGMVEVDIAVGGVEAKQTGAGEQKLF